MGKYEAQRNFRCPECWRAYNSASTVENHRRKSQGECIMYNPAHAGEIATYRRKNKITKYLPMPKQQGGP